MTIVHRTYRTWAIVAAILAVRAASAQSVSYATIYSFQSGTDGGDPRGALLVSKSALYGSTYFGGTSNDGTIFALTPAAGNSWTETILYNFSGYGGFGEADGVYPATTLIYGSSGSFYGTTYGGGPGLGGVAFELTPPSTAGGAWTETVVYGFSRGAGDQMTHPNGALAMGPNGVLFATTTGGNLCEACGLAVALIPPATAGGTWTEDVIYSLQGSTASLPYAGLVSVGEALFGTGTDYYNGDSCCGAVYELTPAGGGAYAETIIHTFTGPPGDGSGPQAALTPGPGGVLYGTTYYGGPGTQCSENGLNFSGCGTVFQVTPPAAPGGTWTESVIYNFSGRHGDGAFPSSTLVLGENGALYGTTQYGGSATSGSPCAFQAVSGCGTIFELKPPAEAGGVWTERVLHSFTGVNGDGSVPVAGLALGPAGVFFGTASGGGIAGKGTVFAIKP
jgi:uncharacterized repeat protein (TIGR03803 family)